MKYFSTFTTTAEYNAEKSNLITPHVSLITENNGVEYLPVPASSKDYLTFVVLGDGKFEFTNYSAIQYSLDRGKTWTNLSSTGVTVYSGQRISWKANITPQGYVGVGTFSSTCDFNAEGNAMSLMYGDDFVGQRVLKGTEAYSGFVNLFEENTHIINAENLQLPATGLTEYCYFNMFYGCTSLITPPELPMPELGADGKIKALGCYYGMFMNCTSLERSPKLEAPYVNYGCYDYMFWNCPSLKEITCYVYSTENISSLYSNVALEGTFYKADVPDYAIENIVPDGWTIVQAQ